MTAYGFPEPWVWPLATRTTRAVLARGDVLYQANGLAAGPLALAAQ